MDVIAKWKQMQHYHGDYLTKVTHWFKVSFLILLAVRHDDLRTHSSCRDVG